MRSYYSDKNKKLLPIWESNIFGFMFCIAFVNLIHTKEDAAGQNAIIMKFITPYSPERAQKRKETTNRKLRLNAQYHVRKTTGEILIVCSTAFRNIIGIGNK